MLHMLLACCSTRMRRLPRLLEKGTRLCRLLLRWRYERMIVITAFGRRRAKLGSTTGGFGLKCLDTLWNIMDSSLIPYIEVERRC